MHRTWVGWQVLLAELHLCASEEDGPYIDEPDLKARIIGGDFRLEVLWTSVEWIKAFQSYSTSIPKPRHVELQIAMAAPDPFQQWIEETFVVAKPTTDAATCTTVKKACAE